MGLAIPAPHLPTSIQQVWGRACSVSSQGSCVPHAAVCDAKVRPGLDTLMAKLCTSQPAYLREKHCTTFCVSPVCKHARAVQWCLKAASLAFPHRACARPSTVTSLCLWVLPALMSMQPCNQGWALDMQPRPRPGHATTAKVWARNLSRGLDIHQAPHEVHQAPCEVHTGPTRSALCPMCNAQVDASEVSQRAPVTPQCQGMRTDCPTRHISAKQAVPH